MSPETAGAMGRCATCGFTPPYPTVACPQCGGRVTAGASPAPSDRAAFDPAASVSGAAGSGPMPAGDSGDAGDVVDGGWADRTMRRSDLAAPPPLSPVPPAAPGSAGSPGFPSSVPPPPPSPATAGQDWAAPPGGTAYPMPVQPAQPVDLGTRFIALLLDAAILVVPFFVIGLFGLLVGRSSILGLLVNLVLLALWVVGLVLLIVPLARIGQTIGKRTMGVQVVDAATGGPIGVGRSLARSVVWWLMGVPCYLGYISYFTDGSGYNRGFHDQAANSMAVAVPKVPIGQAIQDVVRSLHG